MVKLRWGDDVPESITLEQLRELGESIDAETLDDPHVSDGWTAQEVIRAAVAGWEREARRAATIEAGFKAMCANLIGASNV